MMAKEYVDAFEQRHYSDQEIRREILSLFRQDLLSGMSASVLSSAESREKCSGGDAVRSVSIGFKAFALAFIICLNAVMLLYIYLFAMQQPANSQEAWFQSFVIWLLMNVCLVSTVTVWVNYVLLPYLSANDVMRSQREVLYALQSQSRAPHAQAQDDDVDNATALFNAADYFFVSTAVAKHYPEYAESKFVMSFSTVWPRQSYTQVKTSDRDEYTSSSIMIAVTSLSSVVVYIVNAFVQSPEHLQEMMMDIVMTSGIGFTVMGFIKLYDQQPGVLVVPIAVVAALVYVFIRYVDRHPLWNHHSAAAVAAVTPLPEDPEPVHAIDTPVQQVPEEEIEAWHDDADHDESNLDALRSMSDDFLGISEDDLSPYVEEHDGAHDDNDSDASDDGDSDADLFIPCIVLDGGDHDRMLPLAFGRSPSGVRNAMGKRDADAAMRTAAAAAHASPAPSPSLQSASRSVAFDDAYVEAAVRRLAYHGLDAESVRMVERILKSQQQLSQSHDGRSAAPAEVRTSESVNGDGDGEGDGHHAPPVSQSRKRWTEAFHQSLKTARMNKRRALTGAAAEAVAAEANAGSSSSSSSGGLEMFEKDIV